MRFAVFGAGAVGGFIGGRLAASGKNVVFIARGSHLEAFLWDGLRVESPKGNFHINPAEATEDPAQFGLVEAVILGVKAWQVPEAAAMMKPMIGPDTVVLPLQNGVEAPSQLAGVLGSEPVLAGLCRIICHVAAPGLIRHTAAELYIALGERDNRVTPRVEALREALAAAGITTEIPADIRGAMWEKFIFIAASSGVGAVTRVPFDVFLEHAETHGMYRQALEVGAAVAGAFGIELPEDIVPRLVSFLQQVRTGNTASMQRDIMAGRPSELEQQAGALVRLGKEAGVPTPIYHWIYHSLLPMERQARARIGVG